MKEALPDDLQWTNEIICYEVFLKPVYEMREILNSLKELNVHFILGEIPLEFYRTVYI